MTRQKIKGAAGAAQKKRVTKVAKDPDLYVSPAQVRSSSIHERVAFSKSVEDSPCSVVSSCNSTPTSSVGNLQQLWGLGERLSSQINNKSSSHREELALNQQGSTLEWLTGARSCQYKGPFIPTAQPHFSFLTPTTADSSSTAMMMIELEPRPFVVADDNSLVMFEQGDEDIFEGMRFFTVD